MAGGDDGDDVDDGGGPCARRRSRSLGLSGSCAERSPVKVRVGRRRRMKLLRASAGAVACTRCCWDSRPAGEAAPRGGDGGDGEPGAGQRGQSSRRRCGTEAEWHGATSTDAPGNTSWVAGTRHSASAFLRRLVLARFCCWVFGGFCFFGRVTE